MQAQRQLHLFSQLTDAVQAQALVVTVIRLPLKTTVNQGAMLQLIRCHAPAVITTINPQQTALTTAADQHPPAGWCVSQCIVDEVAQYALNRRHIDAQQAGVFTVMQTDMVPMGQRQALSDQGREQFIRRQNLLPRQPVRMSLQPPETLCIWRMKSLT